MLSRELSVERSLLFLDEIQAAGAVIARLRWFAEELPRLAVIAAGSLLEFALAAHDFSMPVGRVSFLHVTPMGFHEYLRAHGETRLLKVIEEWTPRRALSATAHDRALTWFRRYAMVGQFDPDMLGRHRTSRRQQHGQRRRLAGCDQPLGLLNSIQASWAKCLLAPRSTTS